MAKRAAERVNRLSGTGRATGVALDVTDRRALIAFLHPLDAFIAAVSYKLNLGIAEAALDAGTGMCDLGGHTATALAQIGLAGRARALGIAIVPDCGEAPGLANNLMAYATTLLDQTDDLLLLDGGLPLHPEAPWDYQVTFAMDGLTNEYAGGADWVRDGRIVHVDRLTRPSTSWWISVTRWASWRHSPRAAGPPSLGRWGSVFPRSAIRFSATPGTLPSSKRFRTPACSLRSRSQSTAGTSFRGASFMP